MTKLGRCGYCKYEWNALGQAHCSTCHEHFNSTAAFDRHRKDFECIPVADFDKPHGKQGLPLLVRTVRADGNVWVTALREGAEAPEIVL